MNPAFLGVESSLTGRRWERRPYDERLALALAQRHALPDFVAVALAARGVGLDGAQDFLEPRLRALMPDPSLLRDMDAAVARFVRAVESREKIVVFGDYDVDGGTSAALLLRLGRALGRPVTLYVPDRIKEGYGPNAPALIALADQGAGLVVCVDCGTMAHAPLAAAQARGLDVIVLDHHAAEASLPPAVAVVNPNRLDDPMAERLGHLAACGIVFLFIVAVVRALRAAGFWDADGAGPPDLLGWLDLVALGTVCDVVKLTGLNRAFVAQGLRVMSQMQKPGIAALLGAASAHKPCDAYTAGFVLGPRINAGGRIGAADLGARLLATDDEAEARDLAARLVALNTERRDIEAQTLAEAESLLPKGDAPPLIFVAQDGWHPGVIGIVAARLKEKYHRPTIVVAWDGAVGKGSGRSVAGVDMGAAVIAARSAGLLIHGGGHQMAAGLSLAREKADALVRFLTDRIRGDGQGQPLTPVLSVDGLVGIGALQADMIDKMAALAPYGSGNPEPRVALADAKIIRASVVGDKHVSLILGQGAARLRAIAFRAMDTDLGPALLAGAGMSFHLAGHIRPDDYRGGGAVQLIVDDAAQATGP